MKSQAAKILIVDDHPLVLRSIGLLVNTQADLRVCAFAATAREAIEALPLRIPDLAIVDLLLPDRDGLELVQDILLYCPRTRILVASAQDEAMFAERSLELGAHGYIMKDEDVEVWIRAIYQVLAGHIYLSTRMESRIRQNRTANKFPSDQLSCRELQILHLLGEGRTTRQIAGMLTLSHHSVETYQARLKDKLALESIHELLRYAVLQSIHPNFYSHAFPALEYQI